MKIVKHILFISSITVIELLVSITVFGVIVGVSTGALITVLKAQRQALAVANIQGNASVVFEAMAKEIRTSDPKKFSIPDGVVCDPPLPSSCSWGSILKFTNRKSQVITYCTDGSKIRRLVGSGDCITSGDPLTAVNVKVQALQFSLLGNGLGDGRQPLVTVMTSIIGTGATPEQDIRLDVQTSISPRELEL